MDNWPKMVFVSTKATQYAQTNASRETSPHCEASTNATRTGEWKFEGTPGLGREKAPDDALKRKNPERKFELQKSWMNILYQHEESWIEDGSIDTTCRAKRSQRPLPTCIGIIPCLPYHAHRTRTTDYQNKLHLVLSLGFPIVSLPAGSPFVFPSSCLKLSILSRTNSSISFRRITSRCLLIFGSSLANLSISSALRCRPNLASSSRGKL